MIRGGEKGQSTVEFAVVMVGCLSIVIGLAAILHALQDGKFVEHALTSASHHVGGAALSAMADIFLY